MGFIKIKDLKQSGQARDSALTAENLTNLYYETSDENAKNPSVVYGTPGLKLFLDMDLDETGIYAMHQFQNYLYVVVNGYLYVVNPSGVKTNLGSIGTVNQNVQLLDNGLVVILLTASGAGYLATPTSLTQITDVGYLSGGSFDVLNGYAVFSVQNSNQFFWSELNDAASYNALSVATAEQSPGNIVRIFRNNADLLLFKTDIVEVWSGTSNANLPFAPNKGATMQQGCAAKLSVAGIKGVVCWLGSDKSVYDLEGYTFKKISTFEIDEQLRQLEIVDDAYAFTYAQTGHWFYILTFPTEGLTVCYDITTKKWHYRKSFEIGRWRANAFAFAFGKLLVGDYAVSKIYELDLDYYSEDGETIERIAIMPPLFNDNNRFFVYAFSADFETGVGLLTGQGSDPQVMLQVSYDGGKTYSNSLWRSLGALGKYLTRVQWTRLGYSYNMCFKMTISDPIKIAIAGLYAIVKAGNK